MTEYGSYRGNWMQTYTGHRFYPLDPRAKEVHPQDIAHALSLICRFGGHVERFYSVAEHCVKMSQAVPPEDALAALLHDATEAYVGDMVRPLKHQMPAYRAVEDNVAWAIAERFGISPVMPASVKEADNRILVNERATFMRQTKEVWLTDELEPLPIVLFGWSPASAERCYLERLRELSVLA
ncbi:MAG: phosphohydrolase [Candidatus Paceibacterota bacterium]|jgi:hypothetical protein